MSNVIMRNIFFYFQFKAETVFQAYLQKTPTHLLITASTFKTWCMVNLAPSISVGERALNRIFKLLCFFQVHETIA